MSWMGNASTSCPGRPDPERFAKLALAPARVARVFSDPATKTIQAVVDEDQLSLAIGRNGQNVRLASELTGWKIDLYSSREWLERAGEAPLFAPLPEETREDAADVKLSEIQGLETATVAVLEEAGYRTLNDVIDLEREDLLRLPRDRARGGRSDHGHHRRVDRGGLDRGIWRTSAKAESRRTRVVRTDSGRSSSRWRSAVRRRLYMPGYDTIRIHAWIL